jgi:hypothetical protein
MLRAPLQRLVHRHVRDRQRAAHFCDVLQNEIYRRLFDGRKEVGQRKRDDCADVGALERLFGRVREQARRDQDNCLRVAQLPARFICGVERVDIGQHQASAQHGEHAEDVRDAIG